MQTIGGKLLITGFILAALSGCAGNEQAASDWWGEGDGAFSRSTRSPFGNPNSRNSGRSWNPFTPKEPSSAPWQQSPSRMNNPYAGGGSYPPPPTMPPAPYGGYEGLNPPPGALPPAQPPMMPPQQPVPYGSADPYAMPPSPPRVPNPDSFAPPADVQQLYQQQSFNGVVPGGEMMPPPPETPLFSQPLNGNTSMDTRARAQERFNASAFPATPVPVAPAPVAGARPPIPMAAEPAGATTAPVVASAPASSPASDGTVVKFADGSTRISPENDAIIKQAASQYAQTGYRLLVEGLPAANNPESISKARAQAGTVARYLISYGIATTGVMISTGTPDSTGKGNTVTVRVAPYL